MAPGIQVGRKTDAAAGLPRRIFQQVAEHLREVGSVEGTRM